MMTRRPFLRRVSVNCTFGGAAARATAPRARAKRQPASSAPPTSGRFISSSSWGRSLFTRGGSPHPTAVQVVPGMRRVPWARAARGNLGGEPGTSRAGATPVMLRRRGGIPFAVTLALIATVPAAHRTAGQAAPPAQPSATVPVEAVVLDRDGRVADRLGPASFAVTVDGRPRRVLWVRFVSRGPGSSADAFQRQSSRTEDALFRRRAGQGRRSRGR